MEKAVGHRSSQALLVLEPVLLKLVPLLAGLAQYHAAKEVTIAPSGVSLPILGYGLVKSTVAPAVSETAPDVTALLATKTSLNPTLPQPHWLEQMKTLLAAGDGEAVQLWQERSPELHDQGSPELVQRVSHALENFDFELAAQHMTHMS